MCHTLVTRNTGGEASSSSPHTWRRQGPAFGAGLAALAPVPTPGGLRPSLPPTAHPISSPYAECWAEVPTRGRNREAPCVWGRPQFVCLSMGGRYLYCRGPASGLGAWPHWTGQAEEVQPRWGPLWGLCPPVTTISRGTAGGTGRGAVVANALMTVFAFNCPVQWGRCFNRANELLWSPGRQPPAPLPAQAVWPLPHSPGMGWGFPPAMSAALGCSSWKALGGTGGGSVPQDGAEPRTVHTGLEGFQGPAQESLRP